MIFASKGFPSLGEKFFAIPWSLINYDPNEECFILNIDKDRLKNTSGFDKNNWPDMADSVELEPLLITSLLRLTFVKFSFIKWEIE